MRSTRRGLAGWLVGEPGLREQPGKQVNQVLMGQAFDNEGSDRSFKIQGARLRKSFGANPDLHFCQFRNDARRQFRFAFFAEYEFIQGNSSLAPGALMQVGVEFRLDCRVVRFQEQKSDAKGDDAEQPPADKRQVEGKHAQLMAACHLNGSLQRFAVSDLRIFRQDPGRHPDNCML